VWGLRPEAATPSTVTTLPDELPPLGQVDRWVPAEATANICEVGDEVTGDPDVAIGQPMATWPNGAVLTADPAELGLGQASLAFSDDRGENVEAAVLPAGATFDRDEAGHYSAGVRRGNGDACFSIGTLTLDGDVYTFEPSPTTADETTIKQMVVDSTKLY
jgi:hypothetical protein